MRPTFVSRREPFKVRWKWNYHGQVLRKPGQQNACSVWNLLFNYICPCVTRLVMSTGEAFVLDISGDGHLTFAYTG